MFLLAIYPGSGDTFLNSLLKNYFKIEAISFLSENLDQEYFVQTQQLPSQLPNSILKNRKVILLIRDGRDCIVQNAHYRYNTVTKKNTIEENINDAIISSNGSHFGGWSKHTEAWTSVADIIIRFEDLIENPSREIERLATFLNISCSSNLIGYNPEIDGDHKQSGTHSSQQPNLTIPKRWNIEFNEYQKELFLKYHSSTLVKLSYESYDQINIESTKEIFPLVYKKMGFDFENKRTYKILIEASKLCMPYNDGTKRYVIELIKAIKDIVKDNPSFDIHLFDSNKYQSINEFEQEAYLSLIKEKSSIFLKIKTAVFLPLKSVLSGMLSVENYLTFTLTYKKLKAKFRNKSLVIKSKYILLINKNVNQNGLIDKFKPGFSVTDFDLVHIPLLQHAEYILQSKEKALITIHDLTHLSYPKYHQSDNIALANYGLELALKHKSAFFSISENTKGDFVNRFAEAEHLDMIPEAADNEVFCPLESAYWKNTIRALVGLKRTDEFFLSVSTLEPRKNLKNAILAFQNAIPSLPDNVYFIVVGQNGWKMKGVLPEIKEISKRIIFTGFMPEESLPWLYREAIALIYVSHYEGFGLPILEAMSCMTPVIFGNNSSMIEVVGDSGYPVDTYNVEEITQTIIRVSNNKVELKEKSFLALQQSNKFNWQKTAIQTLMLYKRRVDMLKNNKIKNERSYK
jgi:glycosyltransferase involved in cell wall biosynthesis